MQSGDLPLQFTVFLSFLKFSFSIDFCIFIKQPLSNVCFNLLCNFFFSHCIQHAMLDMKIRTSCFSANVFYRNSAHPLH